MKRRSIKPHLCNEVRQLFNLDQQDKMHFTREELLNMVMQITGTPYKEIQWDGVSDFMEEELTHLGWEPQETVDTHPNIVNLNFLIKQKQAKMAKKALKKFRREKREKLSPTNNKNTEHKALQTPKEDHTENSSMFKTWIALLNTINLHPKKMVVYESKIEFLF